MSITVTNTKYSQSLKGQSVTVTLSGAEAVLYLSDLSIGDKCTVTSSSKVGYIYSIDEEGNSFKVIPVDESKVFTSDTTPGYLAAGETITIVVSGGANFLVAENGNFLITENDNFLITE